MHCPPRRAPVPWAALSASTPGVRLVARVRVVLADLAGVLHDVVRAQLEADPRIEVVAVRAAAERMTELLARVPADVVVLGTDAAAAREAIPELLSGCDRLGLVTIAAGGRTVRAHVVWSREVEPSAEAIRGAIVRTAADALDLPDPAG